MHYLSQSIAIVLSLFIFIIWRTHKKTGTSSEPIFLMLITVAFASEILDLATQFAIAPYPLYTTETVTTIIVKAYLVSLIVYLFIMGIYVDKNINPINKEKKYALMVIAGMILFTVITCIFKVDYIYYPDCSIMSGPAIVFVMILTFIVSVLYLVYLYINKNIISKWTRIITSVWIIDFIIGVIFQYFTINKLRLPVISVNMIVGIMFLFLCNENPGSKYDYYSECFYYETFVKYMQDVISNKIDQACLMINIRVKNHDNLVYCKNIFDKLINNKDNSDLKFFKGIGSEIYINSDNPEKLKKLEQSVIKDISNIEESNNQVKFYTTMIIIPDIKIVDSFQVIKAIFDSYHSKAINDEESIIEKQVDNLLVEEYKRRFSIVNEIELAVRSDRVEVDYQLFNKSNSDKVYALANSNIRLKDNSLLTTSNYYEVAVEYDLLKDIRDSKLKFINNTIKTILNNKNNKLSVIFLHTSIQELEEEYYYDEYITAFEGNSEIMSKTCLEITNIETISHKDILLNNITELQKYGVKFAVAGFGTGEANLNYFIDLPIQFVRFDKTIVDNAMIDSQALLVMKDINELANSLNFEAIATGKQTTEFNKVTNECGIHMYFDEDESMINEDSLINLCSGKKGGNE